jgi:hypothetical protein
MKIFVTGGSGHLGKVLVDYLQKDQEVLAPDSITCNILDTFQLKKIIHDFQPDIVIHLAAYVDTFGCEENIEKALDVNVLGTLNLVETCLGLDCKFVYVSSEYVFGGEKGNYTVEDRLNPINIYGKTKSAAEYIVSVLPNYQIIRAPFIKQIYSEVFTDQYCSRHFLDDLCEKLVRNIFINEDNIVHIATERASLYDIYQNKGIDAKPITVDKKYYGIIPFDTSLIDNSL